MIYYTHYICALHVKQLPSCLTFPTFQRIRSVIPTSSCITRKPLFLYPPYVILYPSYPQVTRTPGLLIAPKGPLKKGHYTLTQWAVTRAGLGRLAPANFRKIFQSDAYITSEYIVFPKKTSGEILKNFLIFQ